MKNGIRTLPIMHRIAYWLSWNGYLGSHIYWRVALAFRKVVENSLYQLPGGFILKAVSRDWTSRTIYEGTYERALRRFLQSYSFSGMYLDIGANIGSTLFCGLVDNSEATYVGFEPSEQCHAALKLLHLQLRQKGKIETCAIGETSGTGSLFGSNNPNHSGAASLLNLTGTQVSQNNVKITTLDEYLLQEFGTFELDISVLKIDTEGFEEKVIKGATRVLATNSIGMLILEISPNFGDTAWVRVLPTFMGPSYTWFELTERHIFHKRPYLKLVSPKEAASATHQFNLVLVRSDRLSFLPY